MTKAAFMSWSDICRYDAMEDEALGKVLVDSGAKEASRLFRTLLRSYRIAGAVADAAWRVCDGQEGSSENLREKLKQYSPSNFPPSDAQRAYGCRLLEELYDHLARLPLDDVDSVLMEELFDFILQLRSEAG